ncbi:hypothetical protein M378DRAFT_920962 [Amanita muscaria Koide BX008]|uniref:Serine protease n=1 Tax=Amanita muscaria (strain Koide BX008) TaxID=946122 RepID=A0A0C2SC29_AMAMK|nr:hypothetical protein M378DRAFT_920962 [Amanita muscaria Koide BX008]
MYPPIDVPKLHRLDLALIHESVVKLTFYIGDDQRVGSGFFVNIPDSPYEVILTAGHNLFHASKTFTTQVTVLLPNPNPSSVEPYAMIIPAKHIKVSAEYQKDTTVIEADYGVILIPYSGKKLRRGFGFNMIHAFSELRGEVNVSCYDVRTAPGRPVISTGVILTNESTENQLVYEAKTEQGSSGSPVWVAYDVDDVAVVAVHTHKPAPGSTGSRGSRISPKVLRDVFTWASLDTTKQIKAQNVSKNPVALPPEGVYIIFAERPFARLRRGTGTKFDVFPAKVTSSSVRYVLALGDKWVMFDTENQQAILVDSPREQSLFSMERMKNPGRYPHIVRIVIEEKYQLRIDGSRWKPHDLPDAQISGLSMVTRASQPDPFVYFTFEPYKPFSVPDTRHVDVSKSAEKLESMTKLLIDHAASLINQPDFHGSDHFAPAFGELINSNPQTIEDWEQILRPLLNILDKLLLPSKIDTLMNEYCQQ